MVDFHKDSTRWFPWLPQGATAHNLGINNLNPFVLVQFYPPEQLKTNPHWLPYASLSDINSDSIASPNSIYQTPLICLLQPPYHPKDASLEPLQFINTLFKLLWPELDTEKVNRWLQLPSIYIHLQMQQVTCMQSFVYLCVLHTNFFSNFQPCRNFLRCEWFQCHVWKHTVYHVHMPRLSTFSISCILQGTSDVAILETGGTKQHLSPSWTALPFFPIRPVCHHLPSCQTAWGNPHLPQSR